MPEALPPSPSADALLHAFGLQPHHAGDPLGGRSRIFRIGEDEYVLTRLPATADAAFATGLMDWLAARGLPCPTPRPTLSGARLAEAGDEVAVLTSRLPGTPVAEPAPAHCAAFGAALGKVHRLGADYPARRDNPWGLRAWRDAARALTPSLPGEAAAELEAEIRFQGLFRLTDLPRGAIHGAPTPSHAGFEGAALQRITGWWSACTEAWLLDLAVAADTWCSAADGDLDRERLAALLEGYRSERPFTAMERGAWPVVLRAAALADWLQALTQDPAGSGAQAAHRRLVLRVGNRERLPI